MNQTKSVSLVRLHLAAAATSKTSTLFALFRVFQKAPNDLCFPSTDGKLSASLSLSTLLTTFPPPGKIQSLQSNTISSRSEPLERRLTALLERSPLGGAGPSGRSRRTGRIERGGVSHRTEWEAKLSSNRRQNISSSVSQLGSRRHD